MLIEKMKSCEIKEKIDERACVIIPVGSTEQHGNHLPVSTDLLIARYIAEKAAEKTGDLVVPGIPFGYNQKELSFPGTISLRIDTLSALLYDVVESLIINGFRTILFLNGHGWNKISMSVAANKLAENYDVNCAVASYYNLINKTADGLRESEFPGGMSHAGEFETSIALYLFPELVNMNAAKKEISFAQNEFIWLDLIHPSAVSMPQKFYKLSKSGVIGTPELATKKKGEVLVNSAIEAVVKLITSLKCM